MRARTCFAFLFVVVATRLATSPLPVFASWPHDPNVNVALCTATGDQQGTLELPDGAGGAFVVWTDNRGAKPLVYAQRVDANGIPLWAPNGVPMTNTPNDQLAPAITTDGAGGIIVCWRDYRSGTNNDIYAQRLNGAGAPVWASTGVPVCTVSGEQLAPVITSDGAGGAILAWQDGRAGTGDIYAQRLNALGAPQWAANGVIICAAANNQYAPSIGSDGAGGAFIAWEDFRSGNAYDPYVERVDPNGAVKWAAFGIQLHSGPAGGGETLPHVVPAGDGGVFVVWADNRSTLQNVFAQKLDSNGNARWLPGGLAGYSTSGDLQFPGVAVADGAGGLIMTWVENRSSVYPLPFAQHISTTGSLTWGTGGVLLSGAAQASGAMGAASDGAGGAIIAWKDARSGGSQDLYAQHLSAAGAIAWDGNGVAISTAIGDQGLPAVTSDGNGGAIVAWDDTRSGAGYDIYAQNVERFGHIGDPAPHLASVRDVPLDQGGEVKASWNASYLDADPFDGVTDYRVWRSVPPEMLARARLGAARVSTVAAEAAADPGVLLARVDGTATTYWEYVSTAPAAQLAGYSSVVATTGDSVAAGNPRTLLMIEAQTSGAAHWFSAPDSGYSVDNLPPATPAPFTGTYVAGGTRLHWGADHDADLVGYRLYRGASAAFVPGPGNLVVAEADTGYTDVGAAGGFYKLSAIDIHGNESPYALLAPSGTTAVAPHDGWRVALEGARPNPASGARLMVAFTLAGDSAARLELLDVDGRIVAARDVGGSGAGPHLVDLSQGRLVRPGVYFARLSVPGVTPRTTRIAVLE